MRTARVTATLIGLIAAPAIIVGCSGSGDKAPTDGNHPHSGASPTRAHPSAVKEWHSPSAEGEGYWDENGRPVNGGPKGANGSTGNGLTYEYCARNEDPACPSGSYVGPDAMLNPDGSNEYVPCEGSICHNPDHGAGDNPADNGGGVMQNPNGDGSDVPCEGSICHNPGHGAGDNPADNGGGVMQNPNGDRSDVPCEGSICSNPNHGAGDDGNG